MPPVAHITSALCTRVSQVGFDARSPAISSGQHRTMHFPGRPLQPAGSLALQRVAPRLHTRRHFTRKQRIASTWLDAGCIYP